MPLTRVLACLLLAAAGCRLFSYDNILVPINVSDNPGRSEYPTCAVDSKGTVHLTWCDDSPGNEEVLYAFKNRGGTWSSPANVSRNTRESRFPSVAIGPDDEVHLAWQDCSPDGHWRLFYSWQQATGDWTPPETIAGGPDYVHPRICVDGFGRVHLVWLWGGFYSGIAYAMRDTNGKWGEHMALTDRDSLLAGWPCIGADRSGGVHVTFAGSPRDFSRYDIWYVEKATSSRWTTPENISLGAKPSGGLGMDVDVDGTVHVVWSDDRAYMRGGMYSTRSTDGRWSPWSLLLSESLRVHLYWKCLAGGPGGRLYLPGGARTEAGDGEYVCYIKHEPSGSWSDTVVLGVVKDDFAGLALSAVLVDQVGSMSIFGERSPDRQNLDNKDVFCIDCKLKE